MPILRDTFLVPILDIGTGFYAGFAIFTVLGNMAIQKCDDIKNVASPGPELAFIVYPEGIVHSKCLENYFLFYF